ncbi:Short integuments 2, mitochondrial [Nowakowskiella sp. JEL0078]|nr:Short integuments 2, mitochondrial [Nowakowskiella sp. JEL0078]
MNSKAAVADLVEKLDSASLNSNAASIAAQTIASIGLKSEEIGLGFDVEYDLAREDIFSIEKNVTLKEKLLHRNEGSYFSDIVRLVQGRLDQGNGETLFELGLEDDGSSMRLTSEEFEKCKSVLEEAAEKLSAKLTLIHKRHTKQLRTTSNSEFETVSTSSQPEITKTLPQSSTSKFEFAHFLIRQIEGQVENILELRIAVVGNVDAGKSTLLGVLTKDLLDDGRGKARVNLFKHKHEIESGRTSSVGMEIMGFTSDGTIVTPKMIEKQKLQWEDICPHSSKVLTFIDLAGHERYLKTTVFGMTGCAPDFVMLMIGANAGIIGMTKEHLGLALALQVPVYIVITKIDMCPSNILESTIKQLVKILKSNGCRKIPMFVRNVGDVLMTAGNFVSERICPIFQVSNVSGEGLPLLKLFLNVLHANSGKYNSSQPVEYQITDTFAVPGVGTVVSGTVTNGIVHQGDILLLGPDFTGAFITTIVKSIQRKRVNVPVASAGQSATFALKKVKRSSIRKGMVMLSKNADARAVMEFEAEILVLYHSTTISTKYQTMVHCGVVRQAAKILGMEKQILRTGDRALVHFRFMQHPEYLKIGTRLLFREGRTKGVGKVVRVFSELDIKPDYTDRKEMTESDGIMTPPSVSRLDSRADLAGMLSSEVTRQTVKGPGTTGISRTS